LLGNTDIVTGNLLTDYSNITERGGGIIARCVTGLGPTGNDNTVLGGWYFNGSRMSNGECTGPVVQPRGAKYRVGVINLFQCGTFSTSEEGVYTCTIMNSSMLNQSMRLGVYFAERSELYVFQKNIIKLCLFLVIAK